MSVQKVKAQEENSTKNLSQSSDEMTRLQALAVSWTGLEALAKKRQVIIVNDRTTGTVWFGIANAKMVSVGTDKDGNKLYDLADMLLPTVEANTQSVGNHG